jgi:hypothetical protein
MNKFEQTTAKIAAWNLAGYQKTGAEIFILGEKNNAIPAPMHRTSAPTVDDVGSRRSIIGVTAVHDLLYF